MKYFVYILKSKSDGSLYTGYTADIRKRLKSHNDGKVISTKSKVPFEVVYLESQSTLAEALAREKYFKSSKAKKFKKSLQIKRKI